MATTSRYEEAGTFVDYQVATLLRRAVGRSVVAAMPASTERDGLLARLGAIDDDHDPFHGLDGNEEPVSLEPLVRLLANRDPTERECEA